MASYPDWTSGPPNTEMSMLPAAPAAHPPVEQATPAWLGGGKDGKVAKALANTAAFLKAQGRITEVPDDFSKFVDPEFAAAAAK